MGKAGGRLKPAPNVLLRIGQTSLPATHFFSCESIQL